MSRATLREREGVPVKGTVICEHCGQTVNYQIWYPGPQPVTSDEMVAGMDYFLMLHGRVCNGTIEDRRAG